ncbi:reverse transcriptase [Phytophthora megakarya]|uniref:Reverse transcriptase n=1 Tax=Phytophthora megakarya TaxID=4795 RepID=A0A225W4V3_9STRA|nr:reverse transcriptase [Phytophthora megakarya]
MKWQNLALEATTDTRSEEVEGKIPLVPMVERPEYEAPRAILQRPKTRLIQCRKVETSQDQEMPDCLPSDKSPSDKSPINYIREVKIKEYRRRNVADRTHHLQAGKGPVTSGPLNDKGAASMSQKTDIDPTPVVEDRPGASDLDVTWGSDQDYDECVYYHEGSDLYAEDVDGQMAVLPEVPMTTEGVKIEDIQLCGSDNQTPEEIFRLRQKIWKFRHLLIGKGNALPPTASGVVCDIDVGGARPIALKCRKLRIQFREKLADLIKGLLSAKKINYSRSPWASPIVVIMKKNGVDIRLCIDYRLVNSLTQLMIYPMSLINDLFEDLESTFWYCSLDMASGFWVVKMTDRARLISAFITI